MEINRTFFDVGFERDEIFVNKRSGFVVAV